MEHPRGRKSAAAIAVNLNVSGKPPRLTAPASLTSAERTLFNELVSSCSAEHFRRSDIPILTSYIEATLLARAAARDSDKVSVWAQAIKLQCTLSTRLRLTPSARSDPKNIGRDRGNSQLRWPWENPDQHKQRLALQQQQDEEEDD